MISCLTVICLFIEFFIKFSYHLLFVWWCQLKRILNTINEFFFVSGQEEKEGNVLNGDLIINLNNLITNIDKFVVCKECAQERELQIKSEEGSRYAALIWYSINFQWVFGMQLIGAGEIE